MNRDAVQALVAAGAQAASTPREVAAASEVVITMLPDAPDVERVALGTDGIVEGIEAGLDLHRHEHDRSRRPRRKVGAADRGAKVPR